MTEKKFEMEKNFEKWWKRMGLEDVVLPSMRQILFDLYVSATDDVFTFMLDEMKEMINEEGN